MLRGLRSLGLLYVLNLFEVAMAKVIKRGNRWQLDYFDQQGKRIRLSFVKKMQKHNLPSEFHQLLKKGIWTLKRIINLLLLNYWHNTNKNLSTKPAI